jgi:hypothetical protein
LNKPALDALFAAVFAAVLGVILAPLWNDFWADMKPAMGAPLVALIGIIILVGIAAFGLAILHYLGVLGAGAKQVGTRERNDYDALRQRIAAGNWIAREYARRLDIFLNAIDRFFGDAGMADRTLLPHAFGLRTPAPLWTARAFDRCLWLALVYPIVAILLIWAVSNEVGPAESALRLPILDAWRRALVIATIALGIISFLGILRNSGWRAFSWFVALCAFSIASAAAIGFLDFYFVAYLLACLFVFSNSGAAVVALTLSYTLILIIAFGFMGTSVSSILVTVFIYCIGVIAVSFAIGSLHQKIYEGRRQGTILSLHLALMYLLCFAGALFLSRLPTWPKFGPVLLNAPFDWLSLGLTRALMRRGLEREKWWPYFYAMVDALLAAVVIALLAIAVVGGVQLFDDVAVYGGGDRLLPPIRVFLDAIKAHPGKPEFWWVYATLFSTMLPSLINLFIAGVSLARGVPGVSTWLLGKVREGEAVPAYDRMLVAVVLSLQGVLGLAIALVAQGFLFWVIIWQGMPRLGIGVLDLASLVAH